MGTLIDPSEKRIEPYTEACPECGSDFTVRKVIGLDMHSNPWCISCSHHWRGE